MPSSPAAAAPVAAATPPRLLLLLLTLLLSSPLNVAVAEELPFNIYVPYSIAAGIQRVCPSSRDAKGCGDACVRYSDEPFFYVSDLTRAFDLVDHTHVDDMTSMYTTRWSTLMARLAAEAASSPLRFSSGGVAYAGSQVMYGIAQRTTNLSNYTGGGTNGYSCDVKYQLNKPFAILPHTPAPRPPSSLGSREPSPSPPLPHMTAKTIHLINISSSFVGLFLIVLGLLIRWQLPKPAIILRGGNNLLDDDLVMEDNFEKEAGPKRFPYRELAITTNHLSDEKKLDKCGSDLVHWKGSTFLLLSGQVSVDRPCTPMHIPTRQSLASHYSSAMAASTPRRRLLLLLTVVLSSSLDVAAAEYVYTPTKIYCTTTNNYTDDSPYGINLITSLVSILPSHAIDNDGFYNSTIGEAPNQAFVLTMCYADSTWADCKKCLDSAADRVQLELCLYSRETNSYDDVCLLRYSDKPFFSVADSDLTSVKSISSSFLPGYDIAGMDNTRRKLMTRLAEDAASSPLRFSKGTLPFHGTQMYGLAQCTRDLNATECERCISNYTSQLSSAYEYEGAGYAKGLSCYIRYQIGPPFDIMMNLLPASTTQPGEPSPSPPVPPPPPLPKTGLFISISLGSIALLFFIILILLILWQRSKLARILQTAILLDDDDIVMEDDFGKGTGPKRFPYSELAIATDNFSDEKKLGEGGFGSVYRGFLKESNLDVAIKRVSKGSKQGKKEYISEVTIISRLRHRNLVQLIGWCHAGGELLLIYELMPNGSLDTHLHAADNILPWKARHEIVLGLGSGLLYLHQEWEQCVLHRDIKPSNIMLDASFNAKLGDFGLARLVNHGRGSYTTMLAGTMGYMDPECFSTGKASTESDVYSFGVVLLEVACGRQPMIAVDEDDIIHLVQWVWNLFERGKILEAADARLNMDFDDTEVKCVMIVGMWCTHPDLGVRPSIKQAVRVLRFEAPFPVLPLRMSDTTYKMNVFDSFLCTTQLSGGR